MEIFLDTADLTEIAFYKEFIDGVTTNPSLIAQVSENYTTAAKQICDVVDGPVSVEVVSQTYTEMSEEARKISKIGDNICVKLPCTFDGFRLCNVLSQQGIMTNMTLCFSPLQALMAAKSGATYVSPFVGRVDDLCMDGISLVESIVDMYSAHGFATRVLAASIRHVKHFADVVRIGADAVTLPPKILRQCFEHPLTTKGLEIFTTDWKNRTKKSKK